MQTEVASARIVVPLATDSYVSWLERHGVELFRAGNTVWRRYRSILVPASTKPVAVRVNHFESLELLRRSKAYMLRSFTRTFKEPTDFWYVSCEAYEFDKLSGDMRTKIRRAYKDCSIRTVTPVWMAAHGYGCYLAAFGRYRNGSPDPREEFETDCLMCTGGPFRFWAAFVGDALVGFVKCVVGEDYVTMVALKVHPDFLRSRPGYALLDTVLRTCVTEDRKPVNNGFRSLDHDTHMQEFLLQFGFTNVYCDVKIVYRRSVGLLVDTLYPMKSIVHGLPSYRLTSPLKALLKQEQIRRSFAS